MNRYTKAYIFIGAVLLFAALTMSSISRKGPVAKNMSNPQEQSYSSLLQVLGSSARSNELTDQEDIYGWLIGGWEATVYDYAEDGTARESSGEWHFGRVLEGRAIQDVWIAPPRSKRSDKTLSKQYNRYGTSLRVYDREIGAWRVTWFNPVTGVRNDLVGRRQGHDIVQEGLAADGHKIRWSFKDITPTSFRWLGEYLESDGKTWRLQAEFQARKIEDRR
ncbi:MAG TPA: hypothetical protein VI260_24335 [Blastocatellia bacterium]|jgi:hypothetical protein